MGLAGAVGAETWWGCTTWPQGCEALTPPHRPAACLQQYHNYMIGEWPWGKDKVVWGDAGRVGAGGAQADGSGGAM